MRRRYRDAGSHVRTLREKDDFADLLSGIFAILGLVAVALMAL